MKITRHHLQTTHQVGPDHFVVARGDWFATAKVVEIVGARSIVHHACPTRAEAELLAAAIAATRTHTAERRDAAAKEA